MPKYVCEACEAELDELIVPQRSTIYQKFNLETGEYEAWETEDIDLQDDDWPMCPLCSYPIRPSDELRVKLYPQSDTFSPSTDRDHPPAFHVLEEEIAHA